jgi:urocanate hydratase
MNLPGITFKITSANGGTIISVNESASGYTLSGTNTEELYIIPDGVEDFDRELGKIITMYRMKLK